MGVKDVDSIKNQAPWSVSTGPTYLYNATLVLWSIAWNTLGDFLKRRNKIDAQVQPFPVVVDEIVFDRLLVCEKVLAH
ncbi:MAG: hypothetical protein UX29_C0021G0001, partial [Parcubacteria group bacterium GW2011_GWA2_46_10]